MFARLHTASLIALAMICATGAQADAVSDFYKDKTVTVVVPAGLGGSIGLYALVFSHHIGRHIPGNPKIVLVAHPGASGVKAASYVYNAAPRDGTVIAQLLSNSLLAPLLRKAKFDPRKFQWLGSIDPRSSVIGLWHTAPSKSLEDIKKTETVLASGGRSASTTIVPLMMNKMIGTKFKIVTGYKGGGALNKAVEMGETHGRYIFYSGWTTRKPHWLKQGLVNIVVQIGPRIKSLPNVPSITDLVTNPEHRQMLEFTMLSERIGLAFWTQSQVQKDRFLALRTAFDATMKDPAFLAEASKRNAPVNPVRGPALAEIVRKGYQIPPAVLKKMKTMVGLSGKNK
jgi:tripartite-type tricarboxylate transporter receptor subunit TctC